MAENNKNQNSVTLKDEKSGKSVSLPMIDGTIGPSVIDVRTLYKEMDAFTFDPGYGVTGSCMSGLTYIDGDQGILLHRGYPIEELAAKSDFLEVAYLLLEGDTPWCMNSCQFSFADSVATPIQWQSCAVLWEHCLPSIMIQPTYMIPCNAWWRHAG